MLEQLDIHKEQTSNSTLCLIQKLTENGSVLIIKPESINCFIEGNLYGLGVGREFLDVTLKS